MERQGAMRSLDEIVSVSGFEIGDPAGEDFYAETDIGYGSEGSSLSSLWASRAYLDRESGDLGESLQIGPPDQERHNPSGISGAGEGNEKGKQKADGCAYGDLDSDPNHSGYFSDSGTGTEDEGPRRPGPFVPSYHDSQAAPMKRGNFLLRNGHGGEEDGVHERGGDDDDEVRVPIGCELEFPLAPDGNENRRCNEESARFAPLASEGEIHRLPAPRPVCIRRPPTISPFYRGCRLHRTGSPKPDPGTSIIQLLTPQGTVGAQLNNVADVQVTAEIGLPGGGYGMREVRSNGGWGGVKSCVIEFKGGDIWELNLKRPVAESSKEAKEDIDSPRGFYDGDDEGTIGAASDAEDAVARLNSQPTNLDFVLGPGEARPYILDVIDDGPNKAVSRYTDVSDYSVHLRGADEGNSFTVRLRDMSGSLVIMWKRVARVEIVLVGGVIVEISAGDGERSENNDGEAAARGVGLRGGGDKSKGGVADRKWGPENVEKGTGKVQEIADFSAAGDTSRSSHLADSSHGSSPLRSDGDDSGVGISKNTRQYKGKGKAIDGGDFILQDLYQSESESHGSIPVCYENSADYVQTLGPPHRIENPEPDYVLGSCPCLDRPITDSDANADPPQCTCTYPASPEPPIPEPWTGGHFTPRYEAFLRDGPSNEPYSHPCTAHSNPHGEWVSEVRKKLGDNPASQASGSGGAADATPPNGASPLPKPLGIKQSPSSPPVDDAQKGKYDNPKEEWAAEDHGNSAPVDELEPFEAAKLESPGNDSHAHFSRRGNVENGGNSSTNVHGDTLRGHSAERNTMGPNAPGRRQSETYIDRHASGLHSFHSPQFPQFPQFYPLHPNPPQLHFPGQPTITTIHFFPPHEFPNINHQHPLQGPHPPFMHFTPFIPLPQRSHPHSYPHAHQPISTLPDIPESNYFYLDGRSARLRFPTPPGEAPGEHQSGGNNESVPPTAPQIPPRVTQATTLGSAPLGSTSRGYHIRLVEDQMAMLVGSFELLRDMYVDLAQRLDSGRL